jgi:hypothetical protein
MAKTTTSKYPELISSHFRANEGRNNTCLGTMLIAPIIFTPCRLSSLVGEPHSLKGHFG